MSAINRRGVLLDGIGSELVRSSNGGTRKPLSEWLADIAAGGIADGAVTYAKIQDVSATSRVLGRISSGAGDVEELDAADLKAILSLAQADISGLTSGSSPTFVDVTVTDDAYDTDWNGNNTVPTKNAIYDKINSLAQADITGLKTSDAPTFVAVTVTNHDYGGDWDGSNEAPTKNAVYDAIEALSVGGVSDGDKGDITVSSSGSVWTIDPKAYEDVASATTTDIGAATSDKVRITGTTTITGFGTVAAGTVRKIRFAAALTLTYNATSLILPGDADIVTAADDYCEAVSLGSGNWYVGLYQRGNGRELGISSAMATVIASASTDAGLAALNGVMEVATKAALSALSAGVVDAVVVRGRSSAGDGYQGVFHWRSGDQSANVTADPAGALWVAPDSANTGASGAWQRIYDGPIEVRWFAPTADGTANDLTPLTRFFNAVMASTHRRGTLDNKVYAINGALPTINVNGVDIRGVGPSSSHDVGSASSTQIKAITNSGFTMLTIAPTSGAGNQRLDGIRLHGITFNANSLAAKGLVIQSIMRSEIDVTVLEATNTGMELGVVATLGEARDIQRNTFRYVGRQYSNAVAALRLTGDSGANTSFNTFELVDINHYNGVGIISENADNNVWMDVRVFRAAGGSATNSIEWRGGSSSAVSTRGEFFYQLSTTVAAIAKGTGTYTVGAQNIVIDHLDTDNGTPMPTEETGATIIHKVWRTYTPTVGSFTGTITSASATGRWRRLENKIEVSVVVTITTNGTGGTELTATLPVTAGANNISGFAGRENASTGLFVSGYIGNGDTTLRMRKSDGSYPGADGYVITISGSYEV